MKAETISQPIRAQSIEEHEQVLENKMTAIKLEYVDRLLSRKIPMLEDNKDVSVDDIVSLLNRYTPVLRELMRCYVVQKEHEGIKWIPEMYDPAAAVFRDKIVEFRETDHDHWIEKTMQFVEEERKKVEGMVVEDSSVTREGESESEEKKNTAGILDFNVEEVESDNEGWFARLDAIVKPGDACISIHLEPLYKRTWADSGAEISLVRSLENLAVQIITKYPETRAVFATSWIVDSPIGKRMERMGFKIYAREKYVPTPAFWWQFVNSNGQIDEARVKKFLETGEAPFNVATGAIVVEDFLKKYLPREHRGKVILKETNPTFNIEEYEHDVRVFKDLGRENWDTADEAGLQNIFSQCSFMQKFNASEFGNGFFDFLIRLKKEGKTKEQLAREFEWSSFDKSFRKFTKSFKYVDREVVIE